MSDAPDYELIQGCLGGRTEAFGLLVERYQHRLYASLVHVTGSTEQARDAAQDAFVHAFEKLDTFRGQSAFYSWLYRIAMNAAISARRKTRRMTASVDSARDICGEEPVDPDPGAEPSNGLQTRERQSLVQRALASLPEEYRAALVLKEMDDLKYEEIAHVLQVPVGTVRSRIHRARQELRTRLQATLKKEL